jgi:site-specific recombinase XerD
MTLILTTNLESNRTRNQWAVPIGLLISDDALKNALLALIPSHSSNAAIFSAASDQLDLMLCLDEFLVAKQAAGLRPRTIRWYRDQIMIFVEWCKSVDAGDVTPSVVERFLAGQRDPKLHLSDATISARYRTLSALFGWIIKRHELAPDANPLHAIPAPRVRKSPIEYVHLAEFARLYDSIEGADWLDERDRVILLILFWSGLRVSEATGLAVHDIDVSAKLICVRSAKGDSARFVPCAPDLAMVLLRYLYARPPWPHKTLFLSSDGYDGVRGALTAEGIRQMLIRRCKAAALRAMNPHAFRHGFAMEFLNAGMQLSAVSEVMGHSNQQITKDIYARWLTGGLSQEYERVRERLQTKTRNV